MSREPSLEHREHPNNRRRRYNSGRAANDYVGFVKEALANLRGALVVARYLFRANMRVRRRRAFLGYFWLVVPGALTALAFTLLRRGRFFETADIGIAYPLFILSGMFLWQSFADALTSPTQQLQNHRHFLSVTPAPFEAVILAAFGETIVNLMIRMAILASAMVIFGLSPSILWLLIPLAGLLMLLLGLVTGLLVAPATQLVDDVVNLVGLVATFGLFLVPVIYVVPAESILAFNPLVPVMDAARAWMVGTWHVGSLLPAIMVCLIGLPIAWLVNVLSRPHLVARAQ